MIRSIQTIASVVLLAVPAFASAAMPVIEVFKSESCGCCEAWTKHLKENGFTVKVNNVLAPIQY